MTVIIAPTEVPSDFTIYFKDAAGEVVCEVRAHKTVLMVVSGLIRNANATDHITLSVEFMPPLEVLEIWLNRAYCVKLTESLNLTPQQLLEVLDFMYKFEDYMNSNIVFVAHMVLHRDFLLSYTPKSYTFAKCFLRLLVFDYKEAEKYWAKINDQLRSFIVGLAYGMSMKIKRYEPLTSWSVFDAYEPKEVEEDAIE